MDAPQQQASHGGMRLIGIGLSVGGLALILVGLGVLPVPGGRDALNAPLFIVVLLGALVALAGAAVLVQGFGRANASGELPASAPHWMHVVHYLIGAGLFALFAMIGTWITVAGNAGDFSGGLPFLGTLNISLARIMFGLGALICWLAAIGYTIAGARKIFGIGRPDSA